jgi:hypothetical protein
MPRRSFPSRRSGRGVYRAPSLVYWTRRRRPPYGPGGPSGTGTITGVATLAGAGTKHAAGSAAITGVVVLAGSGIKHAAGTGAVTGVTALSGTGVKRGIGTGSITGVADLSGAGTKHSGIGSIPRPRFRWQFLLGPAAGGRDLSLTEAHARKFTARLADPSEVAFTLDGRHPQAAAVAELAVDVHVLWSPTTGPTRTLFRGRAGTTGDTVGADTHTLDVTALDYRAVLNRRRLYSTSTLTWAATDQAEIAWQLLTQTQIRPGGDLGISRGAGNPTGVVRDRTYEAGDSVGEKIQELSEVIDGFDWDITPVSASALALDVFYPRRGTDRGVVLEYGGAVTAVRRDVSSADYANAVRYTGGQTDDAVPVVTTPVELDADAIATVAQGRWDAVFGDDGLILQSTLADRAAWQLAQAQVVQPTYTLTLRPGYWRGPTHIWLGDTVRLVLMSGRLRVNEQMRVQEMAFEIGDDGADGLSITVGGRRPDYRRRASSTERRLRDLERR